MTDITLLTIERSELTERFGWQIPKTPERIWVEGRRSAIALLDKLPNRGLAVVGTREPQLRSLETCREWILALARQDLVIVSGFARGIDSAAHWAAIEAGLPTVAVLGCGVHVQYPRENARLRLEILERGGLLLSEKPPEESPIPADFLQRNRWIAALSRATWIVEAAERSGALNTAAWARELDRVVFSLPAFPGDPAFAGNEVLLDQRQAHPSWGPQSFGQTWLELSTLRPPHSHSRPAGEAGLLFAKLREATLTQGSATLTELLDWAVRRGWDAQRFYAGVVELETSGKIEAAGQAVRVRRTPPKPVEEAGRRLRGQSAACRRATRQVLPPPLPAAGDEDGVRFFEPPSAAPRTEAKSP